MRKKPQSRSAFLQKRVKKTKLRYLGLSTIDLFGIQIPVYTDLDAMKADAIALGCHREDVDFKMAAAGLTLHFHTSGVPVIMLWIEDPNAYSVIAHEAVHCADFIMESIGISHELGSTETRAYLVGHIFDDVADIFENTQPNE